MKSYSFYNYQIVLFKKKITYPDLSFYINHQIVNEVIYLEIVAI